MRYFAVLLFILNVNFVFAQQQNIKAKIINEQTRNVEKDVNVVNLSNLKVSKSNNDGAFNILAEVNDTLYLSLAGYRGQKIKVTEEWFKTDENIIFLKDDATVLDEIVINTLDLTGILSIDTKLIAIAEFPFNRDFTGTGFSTSYYRGLNPLNGIYNAMQRNNSEKIKIDQMKKEVELIELMKTKFDREMVATLLSISKEDIVNILQRCNHSERFIYTANDYQIFNAVNECYDSYKLIK